MTDGNNGANAPRYDNIALAKPQPDENKTKEYVKRSVGITFKYFAAKMLSSAIIGAGEGVICYVAGAGKLFSIIFGAIAFLGNLIPIVGSWVSGVIIGVIAFFLEPKLALIAVLAIIGLQMVEEFLLTPLIAGQTLSLKPILIVLITIAAGSFLGFWGILLAVPIAAILKLGFQIFYQKKSFDEIDRQNGKK